MSNIKDFDCVQFQRDVREQMLKEANFDLSKLAENIKTSLKNNELYLFLKDKKEKQREASLS